MERLSFRDAKKYVGSLSTVEYIIECPYIIAKVRIDGDTVYKAKGLATCSDNDVWPLGMNIARGRAEAKLAHRLTRISYEDNERD